MSLILNQYDMATRKFRKWMILLELFSYLTLAINLRMIFYYKLLFENISLLLNEKNKSKNFPINTKKEEFVYKWNWKLDEKKTKGWEEKLFIGKFISLTNNEKVLWMKKWMKIASKQYVVNIHKKTLYSLEISLLIAWS